jgi:hypothetical protein
MHRDRVTINHELKTTCRVHRGEVRINYELKTTCQGL